ncbi:MAG: sigma-54-dependent Fis family transcriptional regulator [Chlorobi bacterium]|nr:sigma-54-dependent Fis family transcriptional regulator [Chlorobiota bacterium]
MAINEGNILVIDDDKDVLVSLEMYLNEHFSIVQTESNPQNLFEHLNTVNIDVILLDMNFKKGEMDGMEGIQWLKEILKFKPGIIVILMTAYGDIELAVKGIKEGAFDFILKPWENAKLLGTILSAMKLRKSNLKVEKLLNTQQKLSQDLDQNFNTIVGHSDAMINVYKTLDKVSQTDANILILGENGTGKELIAREIHRKSLRRNGVFINVDLGAVNETLFESEMFGYVKGAFTDANKDKPGRFELAEGGTIFLDEIANLPFSLQSKLLTVLQNRKVVRIGSSIEIPINIRLICASNMPLHQMIKEGNFRQDLIYRINTVELHLPPLRDRVDDIPILIEHFLKIYSHKYKKEGIKIEKSTITRLKKHSWPGNIRELQNAVERAIILSNSDKITIEDFLLNNAQAAFPYDNNLNISDMEKALVIRAIDKNNGNITRAAKDLGIKRNALYRRIEKYDL